MAFLSVPGLEWIAEDDNTSVEIHRHAAEIGLSWVAVDEDDRPVAFLVAEDERPDLHIEEIAVRHDRQKQGLGRALIEQAIGTARAKGYRAVTLTTFREVPWNAPFYRKLGFETLEAAQLNARLVEALRSEEVRFPAGSRCAMRLGL